MQKNFKIGKIYIITNGEYLITRIGSYMAYIGKGHQSFLGDTSRCLARFIGATYPHDDYIHILGVSSEFEVYYKDLSEIQINDIDKCTILKIFTNEYRYAFESTSKLNQILENTISYIDKEGVDLNEINYQRN